MSDRKTTFQQVLNEILKFRDERNWKQYHHPRKLATSISLEAAELLEHFQWEDDKEVEDLKKDSKRVAEMKSELADILIYSFEFAERLGIDISEAMLDKLEKVKHKYPVEKFNAASKDLSLYTKVKISHRQKKS